MQLPLFVYGTLMPGERNWPLLEEHCTAHERATIEGWQLWHLDAGNYPAITPGDGAVEGALIQITEARWASVLATLDRLEDYTPEAPDRSLYLRERSRAILQDGSPRDVWLYVWNPTRRAELEQGGRLIHGRSWHPLP